MAFALSTVNSVAARNSTFVGPSTKKATVARAAPARAFSVRAAVAEGPKTTKDASLADVMAFGGVGPELINGRLAMLGFLSCMGAEYATHQTFVEQVSDAPTAIMASAAVFVLASFMPKFRGDEMNPEI